jgi:hypothetical protein
MQRKYLLNKFNRVLIISLAAISPAAAHTVKTDGNVGATFHIEPDHNPRAGKPAQAWFALTRQGGQLIPLEACQCRLLVYRSSEKIPIFTPTLTSFRADQYRNIPGAAIMFPDAGVYTLELSGSPKAKAAFDPFKLVYSVTVLPGVPAQTETTETKLHSNKLTGSTDAATRGGGDAEMEIPSLRATPSEATQAKSVPATQETLPWWQLGAIALRALLTAIALGFLLAIANFWLFRNRTSGKGK